MEALYGSGRPTQIAEWAYVIADDADGDVDCLCAIAVLLAVCLCDLLHGCRLPAARVRGGHSDERSGCAALSKQRRAYYSATN